MTEIYDAEHVTSVLREAVKREGLEGDDNWAERRGIKFSTVKHILYEGDAPSARVAAALGYERRVVYLKRR